jgi:toxin ParE1/3/4
MARLEFDEDAINDLEEITRYIGVEQGRPAAAEKMVGRIRDKCELLATQPGMGEPRPDLLEGIRLYPVRPYIIFFYPLRDGIRVLRILHGARDYPRLFRRGQ